ncbi:MAG: UDP-N-acetylmuramate--L-alanine ligase [Actinobacteria bacterium]|nr:UDP-N-acetylmuramate--L-alanine ligase [Actinomycetota bacterium]
MKLDKKSTGPGIPGKYKKFFLVGIGGAGMSAIALVLSGMGFKVSGSDIKESRYTSLLAGKGIRIFIGHNPENIQGCEALVYSSAIPDDNAELIAAKKAKIAVFSRSDVLAWILNSKKGIAIAGTHGKTTTTSMASLIFRSLGMDPTIIVGGELNELGSNASFGKGDFVIAEACESDGSFLKYRPLASAITNIEEDHFDYYKDIEDLEDSFVKFLNKTRHGGFITLNGDGLRPLISRISGGRKVITYGIGNDNDLFAEDAEFFNFGSSFNLSIKDSGEKHRVVLNVPGFHNVMNSMTALSLCYGLGLDIKKSIKSLKSFTGVKRRFEKRGEKHGAMIFDDYAHHPTEVEATLTAAAGIKKGRVITVFQPHRYTRLAHLLGSFGKCFTESDVLVITDVYGSGEQPIPGITGKLLIDQLMEDGFSNKIIYIPRLKDIAGYLDLNMKSGDIVLMMGAGDITRVTDELLRA